MIRLCHPLNKTIESFSLLLRKKKNSKILTLLYTVLHNKLNSPFFFFFFNLFSFHLKTCFSRRLFLTTLGKTVLDLSSPQDKIYFPLYIIPGIILGDFISIQTYPWIHLSMCLSFVFPLWQINSVGNFVCFICPHVLSTWRNLWHKLERKF